MKLLFSAVLIIMLSALFSAEIRDGQLFLEVHIFDGNQIDLSSQGCLKISEIGSPLSQSYTGLIKLSLQAPETQAMWGLINKIEEISTPDLLLYPDDFIRDKFVWKDSKLTLIHEKLTFEDKYFPSLEAAKAYAAETGYPVKQIHRIPMQGASIKVSKADNSSDYFQLPIRIDSIASTVFNGLENTYNGSFILKADNGELEINNLQDIETYVAGVVPNEIGDTAPAEALKMQCVAVRTHAISMLLANKHLDDGYDLCSTTHCQVYKGNHLVGEKIISAVKETNSIVLLYDGRIADAVYHSNCGGKTEASQEAWSGKPIPYLQGVACNAELDSTDLSVEAKAVHWINESKYTSGMASWEKRSEMWDKTITRISLESNTGVTNLSTLVVIHRGVSGRITKLKLIGDKEVSLNGEYKIRQAFGNLPSSFFYVDNGTKSTAGSYTLGDNIYLKGKGFGHGVGLCQVGALQKARAGWSWQDILSFYFPGTTLSAEWLDGSVTRQRENSSQ
jgi:SpoIID/LytB domain protein